MAYQWPPEWVSITVPPERPAAYKLTRAGNIELALDLTRELAGARLEAPMRGLTTTGELSEASQGPTMTTDEARAPPRRTSEYYDLPLNQPGRPAVRPLTIMTQTGPQPAPPGARGPQKPYTRREFSVALIPNAAVQAFREFLRRLPSSRRSVRWYVWGAAWSIYLSKIEAPTFGYFTRAAAQGSLVYSVPEPTVRQRAFRPSQVTEEVMRDTRGGEFVPVTFFTVAALIRYVMGTDLRAPDFDHAMRANEWTVCGRIPRAQNGIWCPTRAPTRQEREEIRTSTQVPLPGAELLGEATGPRPRQATF